MSEEGYPELGADPIDEHTEVTIPGVASESDYYEQDSEDMLQEELQRNVEAEDRLNAALDELTAAGYDEKSIRFLLRRRGFMGKIGPQASRFKHKDALEN